MVDERLNAIEREFLLCDSRGHVFSSSDAVSRSRLRVGRILALGCAEAPRASQSLHHFFPRPRRKAESHSGKAKPTPTKPRLLCYRSPLRPSELFGLGPRGGVRSGAAQSIPLSSRLTVHTPRGGAITYYYYSNPSHHGGEHSLSSFPPLSAPRVCLCLFLRRLFAIVGPLCRSFSPQPYIHHSHMAYARVSMMA
jgi:hypothetical protein